MTGRAGPVFYASYSGECSECFEEFDAGDEIRYNPDGEIVAHECSEGCGRAYDEEVSGLGFEP
jgi:hypothetical protein